MSVATDTPFHRALHLPDLIHGVIDQYAGRSSTLSSFSLVSTLWRRPAQARLFSSVFVIADKPDRSLPSLASFLDTHSDLLCHIHRVHIRPVNNSVHAQHSTDATRLDLHDLYVVLNKLSRLRTLYIDMMDIVPSSFIPNGRIRLQILQFSKTCIREVNHSYEASLVGFFALFSEINVLRGGFMFEPNEDHPQAISPRERILTRVRAAEISDPGLPTFIRQFGQCIRAVDLSSVRLQYSSLDWISGYSSRHQAWIDIAPYMKEFEFSIPQCTSTRSVTL